MARRSAHAKQMAELTRQSSRERFMVGFLTEEVGLHPSVAAKYAPGLVEEGFDTELGRSLPGHYAQGTAGRFRVEERPC